MWQTDPRMCRIGSDNVAETVERDSGWAELDSEASQDKKVGIAPNKKQQRNAAAVMREMREKVHNVQH